MGQSGSRSVEPVNGSQVLLPGGKVHLYAQQVTVGQVMRDFPDYVVIASILGSSRGRLRSRKVLKANKLYVLRAKRDLVEGLDGSKDWAKDERVMAFLEEIDRKADRGRRQRWKSGLTEEARVNAGSARLSSQKDSGLSSRTEGFRPSQKCQHCCLRTCGKICPSKPEASACQAVREAGSHDIVEVVEEPTDGSDAASEPLTPPLTPRGMMEAVLMAMEEDCRSDDERESCDGSEDSTDSSQDSSEDCFDLGDSSDGSQDGSDDGPSSPPMEDRQTQLLAYLQHHVKNAEGGGMNRKWRPSLAAIKEAEAVAIREGVEQRLGGRAKMRLQKSKAAGRC